MWKQLFFENCLRLLDSCLFRLVKIILDKFAHALQAVLLVSESHLLQRITQHLAKGFYVWKIYRKRFEVLVANALKDLLIVV